MWGEPKIISKPDNSLTTVGFFSPVEPTTSLPNTFSHIGGGHYSLETVLPAQILFFLAPGQQVVPPYDLEMPNSPPDSNLTVSFGWEVYGTQATAQPLKIPRENASRASLHIPLQMERLFSSSTPPSPIPRANLLLLNGATRNPCSTGVLFQVLLNGQSRFEHSQSPQTGQMRTSLFLSLPVKPSYWNW